MTEGFYLICSVFKRKARSMLPSALPCSSYQLLCKPKVGSSILSTGTIIVLDIMRVFAFPEKKAPGGLPTRGLPHFPNSLALEVHSCRARIQIRVTACPARIVSERNSQLARFQAGIQKTPSKFRRDLRGWIFRCQASKRGYVTIRPRPVLHDVHLPESLSIL